MHRHHLALRPVKIEFPFVRADDASITPGPVERLRYELEATATHLQQFHQFKLLAWFGIAPLWYVLEGSISKVALYLGALFLSNRYGDFVGGRGFTDTAKRKFYMAMLLSPIGSINMAWAKELIQTVVGNLELLDNFLSEFPHLAGHVWWQRAVTTVTFLLLSSYRSVFQLVEGRQRKLDRRNNLGLVQQSFIAVGAGLLAGSSTANFVLGLHVANQAIKAWFETGIPTVMRAFPP